MKKIILLMIVLVIISGCRKQTGIDVEVIEYHKGVDGVEMKFVENLPPREIIERSNFVIGVELRNKGAYDVEAGRITVYGFEGGYTSIDVPEIDFDIEGKKPGFPEGGYEIINFQAKNIAIPEIVDVYDAPFTVRTFYRYETEAGTEVCINPNIYSYVENRYAVCKPEEVKLTGGHGAPVAVTRIEESFAPYGNDIKVNFIIHFQNKGDGEVIEGVYIDEVMIADEELECVADFIEMTDDKEKTVVCSMQTSLSQGAYLAPMLVRLGYDYTSKLDKTLKIRSISK